MKTLEYQGTCICGHGVTSTFKKPTFVTPAVSIVKCDGCDSKFLVKIHLKATPQGKKFETEVQEVEISKKAKLIAKKRIQARKSDELGEAG